MGRKGMLCGWREWDQQERRAGREAEWARKDPKDILSRPSQPWQQQQQQHYHLCLKPDGSYYAIQWCHLIGHCEPNWIWIKMLRFSVISWNNTFPMHLLLLHHEMRFGTGPSLFWNYVNVFILSRCGINGTHSMPYFLGWFCVLQKSEWSFNWWCSLFSQILPYL